jgi:ATP-binding protein involved in chromosome partitioning
MTTFEKIDLPDVKKIIVVASGKGGVGKSTVSVNLAIGLARQGFKTALVDADIFGPSIPRMTGIENIKPDVSAIGDKEILFPVKKYGVSIMSIGFYIDRSQGLIWRGPMAAKALTQLFEDTQWGEIDYMVVDFPPGTSDIQLTTVQKLNVHSAIIVTTPQEISLNDARKAASLFMNDDLKVPIAGVIENMSWFTPANHPEEKYFIFGKGGGERLANELGTKLLGQVPFVMEVGEAAEKGITIYNQKDKNVLNAFDNIISEVIKEDAPTI